MGNCPGGFKSQTRMIAMRGFESSRGSGVHGFYFKEQHEAVTVPPHECWAGSCASWGQRGERAGLWETGNSVTASHSRGFCLIRDYIPPSSGTALSSDCLTQGRQCGVPLPQLGTWMLSSLPTGTVPENSPPKRPCMSVVLTDCFLRSLTYNALPAPSIGH